jgi:hypothetical protein
MAAQVFRYYQISIHSLEWLESSCSSPEHVFMCVEVAAVDWGQFKSAGKKARNVITDLWNPDCRD